MSLASNSNTAEKWALQNSCLQWLCPSSSPEGSPGLANGSAPGSFQTTASMLIQVVRDCTNPLTEKSVSYSPPTFLNRSPAGFQSQTFARSSSLCWNPRAGELPVWIGFLALRGYLCSYEFFLAGGSPCSGRGSRLDLHLLLLPPSVVPPSLHLFCQSAGHSQI